MEFEGAYAVGGRENGRAGRNVEGRFVLNSTHSLATVPFHLTRVAMAASPNRRGIAPPCQRVDGRLSVAMHQLPCTSCHASAGLSDHARFTRTFTPPGMPSGHQRGSSGLICAAL